MTGSFIYDIKNVPNRIDEINTLTLVPPKRQVLLVGPTVQLGKVLCLFGYVFYSP